MISRNKKQKVTSSARVAFFVSRYDIGSSSSIINSAIMLAQSGYHVDIFLYQVSNPHWVKFGNERICIHDLSDVPKTSFNFSAKLRHAIKMVLRFFLPLKTRDRLRRLFKRDLKHKIASGSIRDPEFAIIPESVLNAAEAVMRGKHYQCFFGMESEGLIFAGWLATKFNVPVLYFSMELYYSNHPDFRGERFALLKQLERKYHAQAISTIIQDEERGRLLLDDNGLTESQMFYVPVAMLGKPIHARGRYFHERFGLPDSERIVLQLGYLHKGRLTQQVAEAAQALPDGWTLVMHGFIERQMVNRIRKLDKLNKIHISRDLVDFNYLQKLVSSADIGLVFYTDDNLNDYNTGLASDKMARFVQCGIPVITVDFPSFRRIVDEHKCGICVNGLQEILDALRKIEADYEMYRTGAFRCFADNYEFSRHFQQVLEFVLQLG